jgi:ParB-like chromosome segregation protein Spo0J
MATLTPHPVATLFPDLSARDYAALREDIRLHGVKVPILVHGGEILDGRHRYRACRELGRPCPAVEWNGSHPWIEVQSRNLLRRHLAKEQVCAIQILAAERFPQVAAVIETAKAEARQRKAQAKSQPRGRKALSRSQDRQRESADVVGAQLGVSGATVKRVDRLARMAPDLLLKVAAGQLSAKKALNEALTRTDAKLRPRQGAALAFPVETAVLRLRRYIKAEWSRCPRECRTQFLDALRQQLHELMQERAATHVTTPAHGEHRAPFIGRAPRVSSAGNGL